MTTKEKIYACEALKNVIFCTPIARKEILFQLLKMLEMQIIEETEIELKDGKRP